MGGIWKKDAISKYMSEREFAGAVEDGPAHSSPRPHPPRVPDQYSRFSGPDDCRTPPDSCGSPRASLGGWGSYSGIRQISSTDPSQNFPSLMTLYASRKFIRAMREMRHSSRFSSPSSPPRLANKSVASSATGTSPEQPRAQRHLGDPSHYQNYNSIDTKDSDDKMGFVNELESVTLRGDFPRLIEHIRNNWMSNILLLIFPLLMFSRLMNWSDTVIFIGSCITMIPLVCTHVCTHIEYSMCMCSKSPSLADSVHAGEFVNRFYRRGGYLLECICRRPAQCNIREFCGNYCSSAGTES